MEEECVRYGGLIHRNTVRFKNLWQLFIPKMLHLTWYAALYRALVHCSDGK